MVRSRNRELLSKLQKLRLLRIIKLTFLLVLTFLYVNYYMYDQMRDFIKGRTTITTRLKEVDQLQPPTISVCMNPGQKTSKAKAYGFKKFYDWIFEDVEGVTQNEVIGHLSYTLNQDFSLRFGSKESKLEFGTNIVDGQKYELEPIVTWSYGICYKIQPLFAVEVSFHHNNQDVIWFTMSNL